MKKYILLLIAATICVGSISAQNDIDAMRYSQITFGGTARFSSMAGSMGALGGDFSVLSFNPAGIAIYRKTELSFTPSIFSQSTSSFFRGMDASDRKLNFNFGNLGIVTTMHLNGKNNTTGWQSIHFGFGYNRKHNFHNRIMIQGHNTGSSLLDTYVNAANGHSPGEFDGFSTDLAWQTYLLNDPDTMGGGYLSYSHVIPYYGQLQKKSIESRGSMGETVISFGGNYKSKVLVGATLGIVNARYTEESIYDEVDASDSIPGFRSFSYTQNLTTRGNGFNFKVGMIYRPIDWLRVGAAIHTPTILQLKDSYSSTMKSDLDNGFTYDASSPQGSFDYRVTTPFKAIGSLGFIINKMALFNVDYEFVDYSYAQLNSSPNVFSDVNNTIHKKYTATGNIRAGGEVRLDPLSFRLGYARYGSPFKNGDNINANRNSYTAGVGFRENNYSIDFAYVLTRYTEYSYLYDPALVDRLKSDFKSNSFLLTFAFRF